MVERLHVIDAEILLGMQEKWELIPQVVLGAFHVELLFVLSITSSHYAWHGHWQSTRLMVKHLKKWPCAFKWLYLFMDNCMRHFWWKNHFPTFEWKGLQHFVKQDMVTSELHCLFAFVCVLQQPLWWSPLWTCVYMFEWAWLIVTGLLCLHFLFRLSLF